MTTKTDRPETDGAKPEAVVYPNCAIWPENILRFHIVFNRPMDMERALDFVRLETEDGDLIEDAIVDMIDGLWTPDQRVLTVLFHPGRVKAGLAANKSMGRPLHQNSSYRVRLCGAMRDANGDSLGRDVLFPFVVGSPQYDPINPGDWTWNLPQIGSRNPLCIRTIKSLDFLGVTNNLLITDRNGPILLSDIDLDGRSIIVRPKNPWRDCNVQVSSHINLEDVCGNRSGAAFEHANF
ncbi:MAG: hypothetical protein AAGD92_13185 [Pseudomonadota bacterium]